jgi:hypothetical protein
MTATSHRSSISGCKWHALDQSPVMIVQFGSIYTILKSENFSLRMIGKHPSITSVNLLRADFSVLKSDKYPDFPVTNTHEKMN